VSFINRRSLVQQHAHVYGFVATSSQLASGLGGAGFVPSTVSAMLLAFWILDVSMFPSFALA
jgi:glycine/D-amino acid oxidase-like deaminating enzyme